MPDDPVACHRLIGGFPQPCKVRRARPALFYFRRSKAILRLQVTGGPLFVISEKNETVTSGTSYPDTPPFPRRRKGIPPASLSVISSYSEKRVRHGYEGHGQEGYC